MALRDLPLWDARTASVQAVQEIFRSRMDGQKSDCPALLRRQRFAAQSANDLRSCRPPPLSNETLAKLRHSDLTKGRGGGATQDVVVQDDEVYAPARSQPQPARSERSRSEGLGVQSAEPRSQTLEPSHSRTSSAAEDAKDSTELELASLSEESVHPTPPPSDSVSRDREDKDGYSSHDGYTSVGSHRPLPTEVQELQAGYLWKFNAKSIPKRRYFVLGRSDTGQLSLAWTARPKSLQHGRVIRMEDVRELRAGNASNTFRSLEKKIREAQGGLKIGMEPKLPQPHLCFSLVLVSRKSLDVAAESEAAATQWMQALRGHIQQRPADLPAAPKSAWTAGPPAFAATPPLPPEVASTELGPHEEEVVNQIFDAIEQHDNARLEAVFAAGYDVDLMHPVSGDTALIYACRQGLSDTVALCLHLGAKNDPHPDFGQTALQAAVAAGHTSCVQRLLDIAAKSRADAVIVNHEDPNQEAPLHIAARCGNEDILELLLQHGAQVHLVDRGGNTCLHGAARGGHYACLAMLLDFGCDAVLNEQNAEGDTALHVACKSGRTNCAKLLVESAADVSLENLKHDTAYAVAAAVGHRDICRMIAAVNPVVAAAASLSSRTREVPLPRPHTSVSLSPPRDRLHPYQPWAPSAGAGGVAFQQLGIAGMARATQANPGAGYFPAPLSERARPTTAAWADVRPASARDQARIAFFTARGDATSRATTGASTTTTTTTTRFFPEPQYEAPGSADGGGGQDSFVLDGEQWYRYDDESGYEYFYNETTGISQWEDPRPKAADGHRSTVGYDGTGTMQGLAGSNSGGSERERGRSALGARESVGLQAKGGSGDDEGQAMARGVGSYFAGAPQDAGSGSKTVGDGRGSAFKATLGGLGAASKTAAKDGDLDVSAIAKDTGDGIVMKAVEAAKAKGSRNSDADSKAESEVKRAETSQAADAKLSASPKESERKPVDHKYEKFRKMLQAGVPTAAVANKMRLAGLDPDPLVSSFTPTHAAKATAANSASSPRKKGSLPDKPEYEKFRKMLKAGVPKQAVIAKMRSEGADASPLEDDAETGAASKKPTPRRSSPKKGLPDDPKYDKYRKMLKAGVPRAAVAAKMKTEGLDASCFMDDDASPSSRREGRQNKLVNIHWKPVDDLPPERLRKSVWANSEGDPDLENDDIEALESLFSTKSAKVDKASATKRTGSRSSGSGKRLLDGRRINNIEIGLARFKAFSSYNELCECVIRQDFSRLDIDSVSTLISMLPTDQEIQMMRRVPKDDVADLGKAEQWFYCIASAYPRFGSKLRTFKTISCFDENRAQCTRDISLVQDASDTILESSSFAVILQRLLAVGNILNEGTYRGNATSISLDSLLSVTTTKGADRKTTVLDYVVRRCLDKNEVRVLSFADDFQGPVQDAARLSVSEMKAEVARLKEGVAAAERLVKALKDGNEVAELDQEFIQKTEAFCEAKAAEVDLLDQRMQTAESRGLELVEYFAEEPRVERIPDVFKTLRQFLTAFRASVDKCKRQIKSEERKKRQKDTQKDGKESSRGSRTKR